MKKLVLIAAMMMVLVMVTLAQAVTIFTSFPSQNRGALGVTSTQSTAAQFFITGSDYFLTELSISVRLLGGESSPVIFELWDNKSMVIYSQGYQLWDRPDNLLGSWLSDPITALGHYGIGQQLSVTVNEQILLENNKSYWLKISPGWENDDGVKNAHWAASATFSGYGYGERMIASGSAFEMYGYYDGLNHDSGDFLAFDVQGRMASVPEPTSMLLLGLGLIGLAGIRRKFKK